MTSKKQSKLKLDFVQGMTIYGICTITCFMRFVCACVCVCYIRKMRFYRNVKKDFYRATLSYFL